MRFGFLARATRLRWYAVSLCWLAFHSRFDEQATLNATITHSATSIVAPIAKLTTLPAFANQMCIRPLAVRPAPEQSGNRERGRSPGAFSMGGWLCRVHPQFRQFHHMLSSMPTRLTSRNCGKATQATEPVSDYQVRPKPSPSRTACPRTRLWTYGHRLAFAILLSQCPRYTPAAHPRPNPTHPFPGPDPSHPTHDPPRPHICAISPHQSAPIPQFRHPS